MQYSGIGMLGFLTPMQPLHAVSSPISGKKLVHLFLYGGCDTANAFVPYQEENYYTIRPTIAIPESDLLPLSNCELGLHPALSGLQRIWDAGHMALFPATHSGPNSNRSHFYQFNYFDRGDYTTSNTLNNGNGWLGRYLNVKYTNSSGIEAFNFDSVTKAFNGSVIPVITEPNPSSIDIAPTEEISNTLKTHLRDLIDSKSRTGASHDYTQTQQTLFDRLGTLDAIDFSSTQNQATYPSTTLGRQLRQTATLLRNVPELEVINLIKGGWDTHSDQGGTTGKFSTLLQDVGDSIKAFYDDLGAERNNVVVVVHSEFSRTAHENGSQGTDHGRASAWFVVGGDNVLGGQKGAWPGFKTSDLDGGRWTAQRTDYRDVLSQILVRHMGISQSDTETIFPGYTYHEENQFIQ